MPDEWWLDYAVKHEDGSLRLELLGQNMNWGKGLCINIQVRCAEQFLTITLKYQFKQGKMLTLQPPPPLASLFTFLLCCMHTV